MPDPRMHALFATAICTGLRVGELPALRWQEVNLAQGPLTVLDSKTEAAPLR
jgi:integrase